MNKNIENSPMNHRKAKFYEVGETPASSVRGALTALEDEFATARSSLQENELETMATDLRSFIRKHPFALLFVGIGLGCVLFHNRNH